MGDEPQGVVELEELVELLGLECVAFLCAATPTEIGERLDGQFLDRRQERCLAVLRSLLASPVVTAPTDVESRRLAAASVLIQWDEQAETSVANRLRLAAGGEIPRIEDEEPIARALCHLARDSFIGTLIPSSGAARPWPISIPVLTPWDRELQRAVLADPDLGTIFKGPVDGDSSSFSLWSSTGRGEGGVQLALLGQRLLSSPAAMARLRAATIDEFMALARAAVADTRLLIAEGKPVEVKAIHGLDGLVLPSGTEVRTQWGILRCLSSREEGLVLQGYKGAGNAVLETTYSVRMSIAETDEASDDPFPDALARHRDEAEARIQDAARMVGLAVVLAKDLPMPAHIGPRYSVVAEPFSWAPALWGRGPLQGLSMPVELSRREVQAVVRWVSSIERSHHERVSVAVGRTISAHERIDPTDAFVDALIAWDALFGPPSGDAVVFRVATGFALLLGGDEDERRSLKKRAQDLYRLRSKVVHGSIQRLDWADAERYRRDAVELLVRALRLLYRDEPDLLAVPDRTSELLMRRGVGSRGPVST